MTIYATWHDQAMAARRRGMRRMKRAMIAAFGLHILTPLGVFLCLTAILLFHAR
jgi:hypothetical protein